MRDRPRPCGASRGWPASVVDALVRGYEYTLSDPGQAARDLEQQVPGLAPKLVSAQLTALLPAFRAADGRVGELNKADARYLGRLGGPVRNRQPRARRQHDVRPGVRRERAVARSVR